MNKKFEFQARYDEPFSKPGYTPLGAIINQKDRTKGRLALRELLNYMEQVGWREIVPNELRIIGRMQIRYIRNDGHYVTGGFPVLTGDDYLMYRSHGGNVYSLQFSNVQTMWTRMVPVKKRADRPISILRFSPPVEKPTKYEVSHNGRILFKTDSKAKWTRFMSTNKYKRVLNGEQYTVDRPD